MHVKFGALNAVVNTYYYFLVSADFTGEKGKENNRKEPKREEGREFNSRLCFRDRWTELDQPTIDNIEYLIGPSVNFEAVDPVSDCRIDARAAYFTFVWCQFKWCVAVRGPGCERVIGRQDSGLCITCP